MTGDRLRLRRLKLRGFKSFADETTFDFDRPIVAVVGPNGCGKSNVVDAIKWVLGEQSAKSLRGGAMADVIFNGSEKRQPAAAAEVTLTFANPKTEAGRPLPFDADEVDVGRVLLRDGTSHYLLGGKRSRLKDVRDAFLDTGIGGGAYGVIEQGQINRLLEADPRERRAVFEEAAGVSRFRVQRKEAAARLAKAEANFTRLADVTDDLERRVRSTRLAASKARTFQEATERLAALRQRLALHAYHDLSQKQSADVQTLEQAGKTLEAGNARQAETTTAEATASETVTAAEAALREAERASVKAENRQSAASQRVSYAQRRLGDLRQRQTAIKDEAAAIDQQAATLASVTSADAVAIEEAAAKVANVRQAAQTQRSAYGELQSRQNDARRQVDAATSVATRAADDAAQSDREAASREAQRHAVAERIEETNDRVRRATLKHVEVQEHLADAEKAAAAAKAAEAATASDVERQTADVQAANAAASKAGEAVAAARERVAVLASRSDMLADAEAKGVGVVEAVRDVLKRVQPTSQKDGFSFTATLVADSLQVDPAWSQAVEAALDGRDQWLLLAADTNVQQATQELGSIAGRVTLLPREALLAVSPVTGDGVMLATSVVTSDVAGLVDFILGDVVLADSPVVGRTTATSDGRLVRADGTFVVGQGGGGLVRRRGERKAVAVEQVAAAEVLREAERAVAAGTQKARDASDRASDVREASYNARRRAAETEQRAATLRDNLEAAEREVQAASETLDDLTPRLAELDAARTSLIDFGKVARVAADQHAAERDRLMAAMRQDAEAATMAAERLAAARVELGRAEEHHAALIRQAERDRVRREEVAARRQAMQQSVQAVGIAVAEAHAEVDEATAEVESAAGEVEVAAARVKKRASSFEAAAATLSEARATVATASAFAIEAAQRHHAAEAASLESRLRLETHVTRMADEWSLDVVALYGTYEDEAADWPAMEREARDLKSRIDRSGGVNPEAIGELEALERQRDDLAKQLDDVRAAKEELDKLICELDKESGRRFVETFEATRGHFSGMFRQLFGGGKADLVLRHADDDDDPLSAGVEVMARPPGKQPATLTQLSGGEKAMTCVALLLSLFKSRPSPLCVLDEVDAPLDEANTERFCKVLDDFLGHSQFVIVTHSKPTMRHADVLYGVTMPERGVSRRVAVRFDQVSDNGRFRVEA